MPLEVADLVSRRIAGRNNPDLRKRDGRLLSEHRAVRNNDPLEVLKCLSTQACLESGQVIKSVRRGEN